MLLRREVILSALLCLLIDIASAQNDIAITNVGVVNVREGKIIPSATVIVRDNKISEVSTRRNPRVAKDITFIDGTGKYLMPGMTDGHIHFFQSGSLYTRPDAINLTSRVPYQQEVTKGAEAIPDYFSRYLRLGITTVADVGGPMKNFVIRDSVAKAHLSPNVLVTGPLFSMVRDEELEIGNDIPIMKISSIAQADSLMAVMLPLKPDYIKIWYIVTPDLPADKTFPVVKHIAERTHAAGLKLAVHATQLKTAELAIEAGADILVHSVDNEAIPAKLIRTMREKNVAYIPTLIVMGNYYKTFSGHPDFHPQDLAFANPFFYGSLTDLEVIPPALLPPHVRKLRKYGLPPVMNKLDSIMALNLRTLSDEGVNIVAGTDAGNIGTQHASSFLQELIAMEKAGLDRAKVLRSATINPANAFGRNSGAVEKGRDADLLLLTENPFEDLNNLNSVELVFVNGKMIRADTLIKETPEMVVQRQLNAYNARNIDAFMATYSDDVELFNFPDKPISKGKEAMRKNYTAMFTNLKKLHCYIEKRIVIGNKIIDHERVKFDDRTVHAVAIYEVNDGLITRVTFVR